MMVGIAGNVWAFSEADVAVQCTASVNQWQQITCTATANDPTFTYEYSWSVENGTIASGQGTASITITPSSPGTTTATVSVTASKKPEQYSDTVTIGMQTFDIEAGVPDSAAGGYLIVGNDGVPTPTAGYIVGFRAYVQATNRQIYPVLLSRNATDDTKWTVRWVGAGYNPTSTGDTVWYPDAPIPVEAGWYIGYYAYPTGRGIARMATTNASREKQGPSLDVPGVEQTLPVASSVPMLSAKFVEQMVAPVVASKSAATTVVPVNVSCNNAYVGQSVTCSTTAAPAENEFMTYEWSTTNGTITSGQGTQSITITGASEGAVTVTLNIAVKNAEGATFLIGEKSHAGGYSSDTKPKDKIWMNAGKYANNAACITKFGYEAQWLTPFRIVILSSAGTNTYKNEWVSPLITPSVVGVNTWIPPAPVETGSGTRFLAVYVPKNSKMPLTSGTTTSAWQSHYQYDASIAVGATNAYTQYDSTSVSPTIWADGFTSVLQATQHNKTVTATVSQYPAPVLSLTGPNSSYTGETKTYSVTYDNQTDPMTIEWYLDGVKIEGATGASVEIPFSTVGSKSVSVKVYPTAYPASFTNSAVTVTVTNPPSPPTLTLSGPTTVFKGETKTYSVTYDNQTDPMTIEWYLDGVKIEGATGASVEIPFSTVGSKSVSVKVYPTAYPASLSTTNVAVAVTLPPPPVVTISGPTTATEGETKHYSVTHNATGSVTITWNVNGTTQTGTEIDVPFATPGNYPISVTVAPEGSEPESQGTAQITVSVSQYPAPTISIVGPDTGQEGDTKHYSVTHNATEPVTIEWKVDETAKPGNEIDVLFSTPGSYSVTVTVYPTAYPNSKATAAKTVTVAQYPSPAVTIAGTASSLKGETKTYSVTYDNQTDPMTIEWYLDGVAIPGSTGQTAVEVTFTAVGDHVVSSKVYPTAYPSSSGTASVTVAVTLPPPPTVTLSGPTTAIVGETKHYSATHNATEPVTITWNVNGTTYTGAEVDVPFATIGNHTVSVTVALNSNPESAGTATKTVTVSPYPTPTITLSGPTTAIVGETKHYAVSHDNTTDEMTITWDVNGTTYTGAEIDVPFATVGSYTVAVTVYPTLHPTSSATTSKTVAVTTYPVPTVTISGSAAATEGETKHYTAAHDAVGAATITWTMDGATYNGAEVDIPFASPGNKTITVTVAPDGHPEAAGTATKAVLVSQYPAPQATLTGDLTATTGETKTYSVSVSSQNPITVEWDVNGTTYHGATAEVAFPTQGQYRVNATVYFNAYPNSKTVLSKNVVVLNRPAPIISMDGPSSAIVGETKTYSVTHNETIPVTIEWTLDGSVIEGAGASANIAFASQGLHNLTVKVYPTAYPESYRTNTKTVSVTNYPAPTISINGPYSTKPGQTERFSITHNNQTDPMTVEWTVKGVSQVGNEVDVTFPEPGTYDVRAKVYPTAHPESVADAVRWVVVVGVKAPAVLLSNPPRAGNVGSTVEVSALVTARTEGIPLHTKWTLPDGTQVEGLTASYTFRKEDMDAGSAVFRFAAYPEGYPEQETVKELKMMVYGNDIPEHTLKAYHKAEGVAPYPVNYTATANLSRFIGGALTYTWDMGDGTVLSGKPKVTHTYAAPGTYTVTLTITDGNGNKQEKTDTVTVTTPPPYQIEKITTMESNKLKKAPLRVIFKPIVTGGNNKKDRIETYAWTINGVPYEKNVKNLSYLFESAGTYVVTLTVTSKYGFTGTGAITLDVIPNQTPDCAIDYTDQATTKLTKFNAVCTDPDGRISSYSWDFGNGLTSKIRTPIVKYENPGTYKVTLTATDDSKESLTVSQDILIER